MTIAGKKNVFLSAVLVAGVSLSQTALGSNLILNGSFEDAPSLDPVGNYTKLNSGSTAIEHWEVTQGSIDYIEDLWQHSDGDHSLDMSGLAAGAIAQVVNLIKDKSYLLTFDLSGNPNVGNSGTEEKSLEVGISEPSAQTALYKFDTGPFSKISMGWDTRKLLFTAQEGGDHTFTFTSLDEGNSGPALDNVQLSIVPIPPAAFFFVTAAVGVAMVARRRRREPDPRAGAVEA